MQDHIDFLLGKTFLDDLNPAPQITQQFLYCDASVSVLSYWEYVVQNL